MIHHCDSNLDDVFSWKKWQRKWYRGSKLRKILAPIKIKSALPPPQKKKPNTPLNREFYGHGGFPAEWMQFFQVPIKLAQPFPAPECGQTIFSVKVRRGRREGAGTEKCHDRASLSRPLVLSLEPLSSLASSPLFSVLRIWFWKC